jgi:hypothetical protein
MAISGPPSTTDYLVVSGSSGLSAPIIANATGGAIRIDDSILVGPAGGNFAGLEGSAAGQQSVAVRADNVDNPDVDINLNIIPKNGGSAIFWANGAPQAVTGGPLNANRNLTFSGAVSPGNPTIGTLGGGVVEIANLNMLGVPTAPTAAPGTNTTQVATTAFVTGMGFVTSGGNNTFTGLNSFTNPLGLSAFTQDITDSSGFVATTEFVQNLVLARTAPLAAEYVTSTASVDLTAERVLTDSPTVTWDRSIAGQIKANAVGGGGGGNVSNVGTPVAGQFAMWNDATHILGASPASALTSIGAQPLDPELSAIAGLVSAADQLPYFTGAGAAALTTLSPFARTFLDDPDIATLLGTIGAQPLDADLTAIAALTGTNTIYYRSAANTWSPVVIGANLTFTGGTLAATGGGGGDVLLAATQTFTGTNYFNGAFTVFGANVTPIANAAAKAQFANLTMGHSQWSADAIGPVHSFYKSRSATVGTQVVVQQDDALGNFQWIGYDGSVFSTAAMLRGAVDGVPVAGSIFGRLEFWTRPGATAMTRRMTLKNDGALLIGPNTSSPAGVANLLQVDGTGGLVHFGKWSADTGGTVVNLRKSRGATPGTRGAILSGDTLGELTFFGDDGTNWVSGAAIRAVAETAPAGGFVDTGLRFFTFKTGLGYTEKIRIYPSGGLAVNAGIADPGYGVIGANQFNVKQAADNLGQGFVVNNAAGDATAYLLLCGGANPNEPRSFGVITNYPGTGLVVYNSGDLANPIARFQPTGCLLKGTNTNDNAAAGYVGEFQSNSVWSGTIIAANTPAQNLGSIALTAGDWDVWVNAGGSAGATPTSAQLGLTTTSAVMPTTPGMAQAVTLAANVTSAMGFCVRFSLTSATPTVYLVAQTAAGAVTFVGSIFARRIR